MRLNATWANPSKLMNWMAQHLYSYVVRSIYNETWSTLKKSIYEAWSMQVDRSRRLCASIAACSSSVVDASTATTNHRCRFAARQYHRLVGTHHQITSQGIRVLLI
jgi:hypothetical protein